jgi:hypothetical protein
MLVHSWGKEAFTRFPDLIDRFDGVDSPYSLWHELTSAFTHAYKEPRNEDLIRRIYEFADWCCSQPECKSADNDLGTVVCCCFYEHIPESPEALLDMPRWFSRSDVLSMKPVFSYMVGEEGFHRILDAYNKSASFLNKKPARRPK